MNGGYDIFLVSIEFSLQLLRVHSLAVDKHPSLFAILLAFCDRLPDLDPLGSSGIL